MTPSDKLGKLNTLLTLLQNDTVKPSDIKEFLSLVINVIKTAKTDFEGISKDNLITIQKSLAYIATEHDNILKKIESETQRTKNTFAKKLEEADKLLKELQSIKLKDGIDGEKGDRGEDGKDGKDGSPDKPEEIRDKLETLEGEDRLDASAIKNLPEATKKIVGGVVARNLYQMGDVVLTTLADNDVLVWSSANNRWENEAVSAGGGHTIQEEGAPLTQRTNLNFVGATVTVTDDAVNDATKVTIVGDGLGDVTKVGTPVNNQVGVWTGDGTLEGDTALTFDTTTDTLSTGVVLAGDGTATAPAYSFTNATGIGIYNGGGNELSFDGNTHLFTINGTNLANLLSNKINLTSALVIGWGTVGGAMDAGISRPSAGLLKINDGTTGYGDLEVADEAYGAGWDGSQEVPTKNALYDKIETLGGGSGITRTITTSSGAFTAGATAATDYVYFIAGAHAVALPTAVSNTNRYTFKNNHSAAITITPDGAETIEGAATIQVAPEDSVDLISNNSVWFVI